jgi:regulator of replication initiation timing
MQFKETIQAVNAIHILDGSFQVLLEECNKVKNELISLREENALLKKENEQLKNDKRQRDNQESTQTSADA